MNALCKVNAELFKMAKAIESASQWMRDALDHFNRATDAMKQVSEKLTEES